MIVSQLTTSTTNGWARYRLSGKESGLGFMSARFLDNSFIVGVHIACSELGRWIVG